MCIIIAQCRFLLNDCLNILLSWHTDLWTKHKRIQSTNSQIKCTRSSLTNSNDEHRCNHMHNICASQAVHGSVFWNPWQCTCYQNLKWRRQPKKCEKFKKTFFAGEQYKFTIYIHFTLTPIKKLFNGFAQISRGVWTLVGSGPMHPFLPW